MIIYWPATFILNQINKVKKSLYNVPTFLFLSWERMHSELGNFRLGPLFLEFNSKMTLGDQLIQLQNNLKKWEIYNLKSVLIFRVLRILVSQNRFQSMYDEISNID